MTLFIPLNSNKKPNNMNNFCLFIFSRNSRSKVEGNYHLTNKRKLLQSKIEVNNVDNILFSIICLPQKFKFLQK